MGPKQSMLRVLVVIALAVAFMSLLAAQPVLAAGITVNSLADTTVSGDGQCTLREALNNVNAAADTTEGDCRAGTGTGDMISFGVTGTIKLIASNRTLMLTKSATIYGPGPGSLTLDGGCTMNCGIPGSANGVSVLQVSSGATASVSGVTITRGGGTGAGGGIINLGSLAVADSIITANNAGLVGGGIENQGTMTVVSSAITANSVMIGTGGGIENEGSLTIMDSTISGNSTGSGGAGILDQTGNQSSSPSLLLTNCTVSGNSGGFTTGGAVYIQSGTAAIVNSLIAGNVVQGSPSGSVSPDLTGVFTASSTYDLIGDGTSETGIVNGSNGNQVGTTASPINPLLGPLANNGGPTPTMALLPGSPAIDQIPTAGGCGAGIFTDQRGLPRPTASVDFCDIGAYEVVAAPLPQPKTQGPILSNPAPLPVQPKPQGPSLGVPNPLPPPR